MAILQVIGILAGFVNSKGWKLKPLDKGRGAAVQETFSGQFIAENMSESIGSNLGETATLNKDKPDQQWLHGESEVFTFRSRLFAHSSFRNVKQQVENMKNLARRDKNSSNNCI